MKLIMTILVRDEADILAANLEYHFSRGIDFVIATDNLSVDGATEVLKSYQQRGLLHYIYESEDIFAQDRWVTRMARIAGTEFGADWIIHNDTDEFWWPENGDLKRVLAELPDETEAASALRTNFLPPSLSAPDGFFADMMTIREVHSLNALGKPMPPKICHRARSDIEVGPGCHRVIHQGRHIPPQAIPVTIFHFPLRSYAQFSNKVSKGGAALARNTELPQKAGLRWRKWQEMLQAGTLEDYYRTQVPGEKAIEKGIQEGRFVRDERLMKYLNKFFINKEV